MGILLSSASKWSETNVRSSINVCDTVWYVPLGTNCLGNLCLASTSDWILGLCKKQPIYKISQACRPVLKGQTDKFLGKLVDVLFIFGLLEELQHH